MATILLQAAGGALGGLVGGPIGALAGRALGGVAGATVDQRLFARSRSVETARLRGGRILQADEGEGIARAYGTVRIAGQVIWATRFEETRTTERQGGKGAPSGGATVTSYSYFGNVAIGLCEGPIAHVRRVWADGEEMDLADVEMRVHFGSETQEADPLIEAKQGAGLAPAYRGLAYAVFERLPLERWGNRIPQISCEVIRPIGELEEEIRAVTIIPGASEHGLDPLTVRERVRPGEDRLANRNVRFGGNDWTASVDELAALCPKLERAALIVAWFGDDLRCGHASVRPGVEVRRRDETEPWRVAGIGRADAHLVSQSGGGPAYGGTPSDEGVMRAIRDLKGRGLKVTHYPFLLMDVPASNGRPDPYGGAHQAAYPWRGRMTLDLAEDREGSADRTAAARDDIERFAFGTAWNYRRMVLHQAELARRAGGVDAFVIGSEMRGLTRIRDHQGRFPFVEALIRIAREVKAILPQAKVTYAADWSEYFGYHPADGSRDVFFNLDPLWADASIDMVGIDSYLPLDDHRDGDEEGDGPDGAGSPYGHHSLARRIESGEYYDWFYASEADRNARRRTPISDGAHGRPWVFRAKDLRGWWENEHRERRAGRELVQATAWRPRSKPIWLTELGCPAIHRGANQPNVFLDPKSSESFVPHFSSGARDDHAQRRFLEAHLRHWNSAANPVSPVYGGQMVDPSAIHLWTWDARPFPAFPERSDVWSDGSNWARGHWLTGRLGKAPLDRLLGRVLGDHGIRDIDTTDVEGEVGGLLLSGPGSARGEAEAIAELGGFTAHSREGALVFRSARSVPGRTVDPAVLAQEENETGPFVERRRREESEAADEVVLGFTDAARAFASATACAATDRAGREARQRRLDLPVALHEDEARAFAASILAAGEEGRERVTFALAPSAVEWEPGDVVRLPGVDGRWRIERMEDGAVRRVEARLVAPTPPPVAPSREGSAPPVPPPLFASRPVAHFLDLPLLGSGAGGPRVAVFARPFVPYVIEPVDAQGVSAVVVDRPARIGTLVEPLGAGPEGFVDRGNRIVVDLAGGALSSVERDRFLSGANAAAVQCAEGSWEVVQFRLAEETAPGRFELSELLRAQAGTEDAMSVGAPRGAAFVLLDDAVVPLAIGNELAGVGLAWRVAPAGRPLDDHGVLRAEAAVGERALRPLSPVHIRGASDRDGALRLRWVRRSRVGADRWEGLEVPLGEEGERYAIRVRRLDASAGVFEAETTATELRIDAATLDAALRGRPATIEVEIRQVSPTAGPGTSRRAVVRRPAPV